VNFGHSSWWYVAHFCQKAGKNPEKNYFQKKLKKKEKRTGVGQKYEIIVCILQLKIHRPMNH
jgi:hypothetical protein